MVRLTRRAAAAAAAQSAPAEPALINTTNSINVKKSDSNTLPLRKRQRTKSTVNLKSAVFEIPESSQPIERAESSTTSGEASLDSLEDGGNTETPATVMSADEEPCEEEEEAHRTGARASARALALKRKAVVTEIPDSDAESLLSELDDDDYDIYESDSSVKKGREKNKGKGKGKAVAIPVSESEESDFELEDEEFIDQDEYEDEDGVTRIIEKKGSKALKPLAQPKQPRPPPPYDVDNDIHYPTVAQRRAMTSQERTRVMKRFRGITRADRDRENLFAHHPYLREIYKDLDENPAISVEEDPQPKGLALNLLPFQKEGLHWLRLQEQGPFGGGILADEMGMGKTIQTLSLIMTDPNAKPNLVVAPTVAIMQWKNEIEKYTGSALTVHVYHGSSRLTDPKELAKFNVILTTYNVLESVYRKQEHGFRRKAGLYKEKSALHKVKYHRVILDEAHNIKDRSSNTAKSVYALGTKYKLCLSGTPLQNRIGELFSLLRFLQIDPFAYYYCRNCPCKQLHWKFSDNRGCDHCGCSPMSHLCFFNWSLLKPIQNNGNEGEGAVALQNLHRLLKHIMLRRTKNEREEDLGLPPKVVRIRNDKFSEEENDIYGSLFGDTKRQFNTYVEKGVVLNNYANIFGLIMKLRQMADHPDLILRKNAEEGANMLVCFLCDEEAEDAIKSKCHHTFCRDCIQRYIDSYDSDGDPQCPKCHITLSIDLTAPALEELHVKKHSIISRIDMSKWRSSTKIEALCEELHKLRTPNQTTKSIVFSQFTSMLQLIEWRLHRAGFKTVMLEGTMSPSQRDASIRHFMETVDCEVFLVSLKAGGVALNLIEASQVFIMDPWWNPAVEWQAADRIHRIGQTRVCRVTRMVISDSIESRIVELQEKKSQMINATVNQDQKAMERLTPDDMAFLFQN